MQDDIFTVDQVAERLALHPKTVRNFIRDGILKAQKIGKQWRITGKDLQCFLGNNHGEAPDSAPLSAAHSLPANRGRQKIQVSTIIDLFVESREEADRLSVGIMAGLNSKDPSDGDVRCDYIFYAQEGKARFILFGSAKVIGELLIMLNKLADR